MKTQLKIGDYVLATKWRDGDPCDSFCVGFFSGMLEDRFLVVNNYGTLFRASGFRRCEKISHHVGEVLCKAMRIISDRPGRSLWYWRRHTTQLKKYMENNEKILMNIAMEEEMKNRLLFMRNGDKVV